MGVGSGGGGASMGGGVLRSDVGGETATVDGKESQEHELARSAGKVEARPRAGRVQHTSNEGFKLPVSSGHGAASC